MKMNVDIDIFKNVKDLNVGKILLFTANAETHQLSYDGKEVGRIPNSMKRPSYYGTVTEITPLYATFSISRFADLHRHSDNSLLDGICKIPDMVELSVPQGALTDHGNMYGFLEFYKGMKAHGKKPIIGCEFYVENFDRDLKRDHLILLAKNETGYHNLLKLSSSSFQNMWGGKPHVLLKDLEENHEGIICTSACISNTIAKLILSDQMEKAELAVDFYHRIFGDDFYLEIQRHGIQKESVVEGIYRKWSAEKKIKIVCTTDSHYSRKEDSIAHEYALCMQTGAVYAEKHMKFDGTGYHIHTSEEMEDLFFDFPEALENTLEVADKCNVEIKLGDVNLPKFDIPAPFASPMEYFEDLCIKGYEKRFGGKPEHDDPVYHERFQYEMDMIRKMGFASYFLIVWDYINWARVHNIFVGPGRGSAAGSLLAYCIGITDLDPIKLNLLFERFLNPERVSWPDIDTDFEHTGRPAVIEYIKEKYGHENVCRIVTFGTEAARMVIKDVGRVMGESPAYTAALAAKIPSEPKMTIKKAFAQSPDFKQAYDNDHTAKKIIDMAIKLEGCKRHASQHACFDADTQVLTRDGEKRIADVKKGDFVFTLQGHWMPVAKTITTHTDLVHHIELKDGREVSATGNHPFWCAKGGNTGDANWINAENLEEGDSVIVRHDISGRSVLRWTAVVRHTEEVTEQTMFNLSVVNDNTYFANGIGVHNCGLVISPSIVSDFLPTAMVKNDETGEFDVTSQVIMTEVEELSLIKMDLLGLKNMTVIHEALDAIKRNYGLDIDYHDIPMDDRETLKFLSQGHTSGVFQLESPGMTDVITRMLSDVDQLPDSELSQGFERMIAAVALYRPGPMAFIDDYIEGMRNPDRIHYDCPEEKEILKSTYGQIVFQEEVMQIVQKLAGYTLGRADVVRKAMGKKKLDIMAKERKVFIYGNKEAYESGEDKNYAPGCIKNGIPENVAVKIWDKMADFAKYAFNRSHAACYAYIAMITAWLSCHYPKEFYSAMMNAFIAVGDKFKIYLAQAVHRGLNILPPDINKSVQKFVVEGDSIRYGLFGIQGMIKSANLLIDERDKHGPYLSFQDMFERLKSQGIILDKTSFEGLLYSGALDRFGHTKHSLSDIYPKLVRDAKKELNPRLFLDGQISLFDEDNLKKFGAIEIPNLPEFEKTELMMHENKVLGFYLTEHPADHYENLLLNKPHFHTISDLIERAEYFMHQSVRTVGMISDFKCIYTKSGDIMYVFKIENRYETLSCVLFPSDVKKNQQYLEKGKVVEIYGDFNENDFGKQIIAKSLIPEKTIVEKNKKELVVSIENKDQQNMLLKWAQANPGLIPLVLLAPDKKDPKKIRRYLTKYKVSVNIKAMDYLMNRFKKVSVAGI